jgi:hypothetical protein
VDEVKEVGGDPDFLLPFDVDVDVDVNSDDN